MADRAKNINGKYKKGHAITLKQKKKKKFTKN